MHLIREFSTGLNREFRTLENQPKKRIEHLNKYRISKNFKSFAWYWFFSTNIFVVPHTNEIMYSAHSQRVTTNKKLHIRTKFTTQYLTQLMINVLHLVQETFFHIEVIGVNFVPRHKLYFDLRIIRRSWWTVKCKKL